MRGIFLKFEDIFSVGLTHRFFPLESASSLFRQQVTSVKSERFSEISQIYMG
jgi:hypothetical protein